MSKLTAIVQAIFSNKSTNAHNASLTAINGSFTLSGKQLSDTLINGIANLGAKFSKTHMSNIIVVNGTLHAQHVTFETLEVNGNAALDTCSLSKKSEFFGSANFINCTLNNLDLCGNNFTLKNCTVSGDIIASAIIGKGKLILDNTMVEGNAQFADGKGEVILTNGSRVGNA